VKHKRVVLVVLVILAGLLAACASTPEPTLQPTSTKPALPTITPEATLAATNTPEPATNTPTAQPQLATDTPEPAAATETPTQVPTEAPTAAPQPEVTTLQGHIAFPVFDEEAGTYNIYLAKLDGSDQKLVVEEASQPALNSTGERIAFRSWKADNRGLIERGIDGGDVWLIDNHFEAGKPTFSPDDQTLLFQSREGGEKPAIYRTVGANYEVVRREAFPVQGEAPAWSADGKSFVYKGCLGDNCGLLKINLDGSSPQQLTQDLSDTNPAVSPDGKTIAFMAESDGNWDIYTIGIDGTNRKQLTTEAAADGLPTWSPDGQTIAFVSTRSGGWAVWAMDPDAANQRLLFELGGSIDGQVRIDVQNSMGWLEESIDWAP
jgi:Tol biopolymer transport system component